MLDFSMLSSDYTLSSALTMELLDTRAGKIHLRQTCASDYPKKMPLETWELDEHQMVVTAAEEIAQHCFEAFAVALNIPLVMPDSISTAPAIEADEKNTVADESPVLSAESPQGLPATVAETSPNRL